MLAAKLEQLLRTLYPRGGRPATQKQRLDAVLLVHAALSAAGGALALALPNVWERLTLHAGAPALRDNASVEAKLVHVVIRLYGALLLGTAALTLAARRGAEPTFRRSLVAVFAGTSAAATAVLLRAQLTGGLSSWNWATIAVFISLTVAYSSFVFVDKIPVFEGLDGRPPL